MSQPPGRPRIIGSPEEFDQKVDEYVASCAANEEPVTFTGMALALGFNSRQSFYDYRGYDDGRFSASVKRAQCLVEHEYEKALRTDRSAGGPIFALKNYGWSDRQEIHHDIDPDDVARRIREAVREADERTGVDDAA